MLHKLILLVNPITIIAILFFSYIMIDLIVYAFITKMNINLLLKHLKYSLNPFSYESARYHGLTAYCSKCKNRPCQCIEIEEEKKWKKKEKEKKLRDKLYKDHWDKINENLPEEFR